MYMYIVRTLLHVPVHCTYYVLCYVASYRYLLVSAYSSILDVMKFDLFFRINRLSLVLVVSEEIGGS